MTLAVKLKDCISLDKFEWHAAHSSVPAGSRFLRKNLRLPFFCRQLICKHVFSFPVCLSGCSAGKTAAFRLYFESMGGSR